VRPIIELEDFVRVVGKVFPNQPRIEAGEKEYEECLEHREFWDDLKKINVKYVKETVVAFLNKWQCRLPYDCVPELTTVMQDAEQWLQPLRSFSIDGVDLLKPIEVKDEEQRMFIVVEKLFDNIRKIRSGRRSVAFTATSKILHMVIPEFFVMCDEAIRERYGCEGNGAGYANFMFRMSFIARDLVLQAHGDKQRILDCSRWKGRTLARLLDNYNYMKYTLGEP